MKYTFTLIALAVALAATAQTPEPTQLSGDIISTNPASTSLAENAFDGDFDTYFQASDKSFAWIGLDLGSPHVITQVAFSPRNYTSGSKNMQLGVFQGANNADFSDALPIYLIPDQPATGEMHYAEVDCSRGFRYVRYVTPNKSSCMISELQFFGYEGEGDDSHLYQVTNLPTVVVNTPGMEWFHERDKEYEMNGSTIMIIADGTFDVNAPGQIRGRGNASWGFPKKPFRIKFESKQTVLGGPAKAKKWTMINNYGDKTLMRNRLGFDISEKIGLDYTPACHFVDLVFNGEYQGTYQLCDQVEVNKNRVAITEMEPEDIEGEALTGGYLVEIDAYASGEAPDEWFNTDRGYSLPVTIKSPDAGVKQQYDYIKNRMSSLAEAVKSNKYTDPDEGYRSLLDLDSFLKHFIVGELSGNTDTYWSVYMSLERGEDKFKTGPVWDLDLAFENDDRTYPINDKSGFIYKSGSAAGDMRKFVDRILSDPAAKQRLTYLWSYAREYQGLDADTFLALIDGYAAELDASQQLNFVRWPIMNRRVHQNPVVWGSYEAEVGNVKSYLESRFEKLDALIGRVEVDPEGVGEVPGIEASGDGECTYYNLQGILLGRDLDALAPGIYIRRTPTTTHLIKK